MKLVGLKRLWLPSLVSGKSGWSLIIIRGKYSIQTYMDLVFWAKTAVNHSGFFVSLILVKNIFCLTKRLENADEKKF